MRVINLDETGIKLITSHKKQMYLSLNEIKDFLHKKYTLSNNILTVNNKTLNLTDKDVDEFSNIVDYIESTFEKEAL